jgi:hypothetical protein
LVRKSLCRRKSLGKGGHYGIIKNATRLSSRDSTYWDRTGVERLHSRKYGELRRTKED